MNARDAADVARRSLCLELLLQRLGLEMDADDPLAEREKVRAAWAGRLDQLGVAQAVLPDERALLERPVGALTEDDLDDLHGRASGALVLLWALGRLAARPTLASVDDIAELLADHGLLGDGSISRATTAVSSATLRPVAELEEALGHYERLRGKAKEPTEPERIVAGIAAHHLGWVLDDATLFTTD